MLSFWYSRLSLNSEHLVDILRDSYCAYSDTDVGVKRKSQSTKEYWYWYNHLFFGCAPLLNVHIIVFMLSPCVFFRFNFDYNWSNTMFYKIHQGIERTHTCVLSRRISQQVHGLSNRCTFALANGLAGMFISRYWVSLIGFGLRPFMELVWHLSTQVNICYLAVYITVFERRRGERRCFIPF